MSLLDGYNEQQQGNQTPVSSTRKSLLDGYEPKVKSVQQVKQPVVKPQPVQQPIQQEYDVQQAINKLPMQHTVQPVQPQQEQLNVQAKPITQFDKPTTNKLLFAHQLLRNNPFLPIAKPFKDIADRFVLNKLNNSSPTVDTIANEYQNGNIDKNSARNQINMRTMIDNETADLQGDLEKQRHLAKAYLETLLMTQLPSAGLGSFAPEALVGKGTVGLAKGGNALINNTVGKLLNQQGKNLARGTMNNALRIGAGAGKGAVTGAEFALFDALADKALGINSEQTLGEKFGEFSGLGAKLGAGFSAIPVFGRSKAVQKLGRAIGDKAEGFFMKHPNFANAAANVSRFLQDGKKTGLGKTVDKYNKLNDETAKMYGGFQDSQLTAQEIKNYENISNLSDESSSKVLKKLEKGTKRHPTDSDNQINKRLDDYAQEEYGKEFNDLTPEEMDDFVKKQNEYFGGYLGNDNEIINQESKKLFNKMPSELSKEESDVLSQHIIDKFTKPQAPESNLSPAKEQGNTNLPKEDLTNVKSDSGMANEIKQTSKENNIPEGYYKDEFGNIIKQKKPATIQRFHKDELAKENREQRIGIKSKKEIKKELAEELRNNEKQQAKPKIDTTNPVIKQKVNKAVKEFEKNNPLPENTVVATKYQDQYRKSNTLNNIENKTNEFNNNVVDLSDRFGKNTHDVKRKPGRPKKNEGIVNDNENIFRKELNRKEGVETLESGKAEGSEYSKSFYEQKVKDTKKIAADDAYIKPNEEGEYTKSAQGNNYENYVDENYTKSDILPEDVESLKKEIELKKQELNSAEYQSPVTAKNIRKANKELLSILPSGYKGKYKTANEILDVMFDKYNSPESIKREYQNLYENILNHKSVGNDKRAMIDILNESANKARLRLEEQFDKPIDLGIKPSSTANKIKENKVLGNLYLHTYNNDIPKIQETLQKNSSVLKTIKGERETQIIRDAYDKVVNKINNDIKELLQKGEIEKARALRNRTEKLRRNYYTDFEANELYEWKDGKKVPTGKTWNTTTKTIDDKLSKFKEHEVELDRAFSNAEKIKFKPEIERRMKENGSTEEEAYQIIKSNEKFDKQFNKELSDISFKEAKGEVLTEIEEAIKQRKEARHNAKNIITAREAAQMDADIEKIVTENGLDNKNIEAIMVDNSKVEGFKSNGRATEGLNDVLINSNGRTLKQRLKTIAHEFKHIADNIFIAKLPKDHPLKQFIRRYETEKYKPAKKYLIENKQKISDFRNSLDDNIADSIWEINEQGIPEFVHPDEFNTRINNVKETIYNSVLKKHDIEPNAKNIPNNVIKEVNKEYNNIINNDIIKTLKEYNEHGWNYTRYPREKRAFDVMKGVHDNESITTALDRFFRDEYGGEYSQGISRWNSGNDIGNSLGKTKEEPTGQSTAKKSITGLNSNPFPSRHLSLDEIEGFEKAKKKYQVTDEELESFSKGEQKAHQTYFDVSKGADELAQKLGILSERRSVNRLKLQTNKSDVSDLDVAYVKKLYKTPEKQRGVDISKDYEGQRLKKKGAYYEKTENGVEERTHIKENYAERVKEYHKLDNIDKGIETTENLFGEPVVDGHIWQDYVGINKKILANCIYGRYSKDFYHTLMGGENKIAEVLNKGQKSKDFSDAWASVYRDIANKETGKVEYDFQVHKSVFNKLFEGSGETTKEIYHRYGLGKGTQRLFNNALDYGNSLLKRKVLGLSLGWSANNRGGNTNMLFWKNLDNLPGLAKNYAKALRVGKHGMQPGEVLEGVEGNTFFGGMKEFQTRQTYIGDEKVDNFLNLIGGHTLENSQISEITKNIKQNKASLEKLNLYKNVKGTQEKIKKLTKENEKLTKQKGKLERELKFKNLASIPNKVANKIADKIYKFNEAFENYERRVAYLQSVDKYSNEIMKNVGQNITKQDITLKLLKDEINKNPELKEKILTDVNNTLGDYNMMTPFEKNICKRYAPFYSWYRTITRYMVNLAKENPVKAIMMYNEKRKIDQENALRKDYQKWAIPISKPVFENGKLTWKPVYDKKNGERVVFNPAHNFITETFEETKANPLNVLQPDIKNTSEAIYGKKFFADMPIQSKRYRPISEYAGKDPETKENIYENLYFDKKTGKKLKSLPVSERLKYIGMQKVKDLFPIIDNNTLNATKLFGAALNKLSKSNLKAKAGEFATYDKLYDTDFGGFNNKDIIGEDKTKSMRSKYRIRKEYAKEYSTEFKIAKTLLGGTLQTAKDFEQLSKKDRKKYLEQVRKRKAKFKKKAL